MSPSKIATSNFVTAAAVLVGIPAAVDALRVLTPSEGMTVVASKPTIVSWGGAGAYPEDRYEIDLHYCGSYSFCFEQDDDCGFWVANVCSEDDAACMQQDEMSSQVTFPEPIAGHSNNGYRVRIGEVGTEKFRCSEDFYLMSSEDAPLLGEPGGPTMTVIEPSAGSVAVAGEMYTVEFDYDNGFGQRLGRFKIDLYEVGGLGDCGKWVTSICDKPEMGCHDSQGDYNIVIPQNTTPGDYKIRVGVVGDDSVYDCSGDFEVVADDLSIDEMTRKE